MGKIAVILSVILILLCIQTFSPAKANSTIIVPDNYPTIAAAIDHATQGDTIYIKQGNYQEHTLVITKQITIIGQNNGLTSIENIDSNNESLPTDFPWTIPPIVAIEIRANNVIITNLTVTGNQRFMPINASADNISIINNIFNPKSEGINLRGNHHTIANNTITGQGSLGISCNGSYNAILNNSFSGIDNGAIICRGSNNIIADNLFGGERSSPSLDIVGSSNIIYENHLDRVGDLYSFNARGSGNIMAKNNFGNGAIVLLDSNNSAIGNTVGILDVIGINHTLVANDVSYGIELGSTIDDASNITFYHNNFYFQPIEARPIGEKIFEVWSAVKGPILLDNGREGNYWSDYRGVDANGDGIGDSPYVIFVNDSKNYEFASMSDISNLVLTDYHPLMTAFDIKTVNFELPSWVNETLEPPAPNPPIPIAVIASAGLLIAIASVATVVIYWQKVRPRP